MKSFILLPLTLFLSIITFAQTNVNSNFDYNKVFTRVEYPPEFNGNLQSFIDSSLANEVKPKKGRVTIQFLIDTAGAIKPNSSLISNKTGENINNLKLQEIITKMPLWTAAIQNGRPVTFQ